MIYRITEGSRNRVGINYFHDERSLIELIFKLPWFTTRFMPSMERYMDCWHRRYFGFYFRIRGKKALGGRILYSFDRWWEEDNWRLNAK